MPKNLQEKLRPQLLSELLGQKHVLEDKGWLKTSIEKKEPQSFILWGRSGCGKTSFARIYMNCFSTPQAHFFGNVKDIPRLQRSIQAAALSKRPLFIFIDEIHFLKQYEQDFLLENLKEKKIHLIAATIENPIEFLNKQLLEVIPVIPFSPLPKTEMQKIALNVLSRFIYKPFTEEAIDYLVDLACGSARDLISFIELTAENAGNNNSVIDIGFIKAHIQKLSFAEKKVFETPFDGRVALRKSILSYDVDASLYWLARLLQKHEPCEVIAKQLVEIAVVNVGLADPYAQPFAASTLSLCSEGNLTAIKASLANTCTYLALAPKSCAVDVAFKAAEKKAMATASLPPPAAIIEDPIEAAGLPEDLAKMIGAVDANDFYAKKNYLPPLLSKEQFYFPSEMGLEKELKIRQEKIKEKKKKKTA